MELNNDDNVMWVDMDPSERVVVGTWAFHPSFQERIAS